MNYWQRKNVSRRRLLAGAGTVGAGIISTAIVGCGSNDGAGKSPIASTTAANTPPASTSASASSAATQEAPKQGGTFTSYNLNAGTDSLDIQQSANPGAQAYTQYTNDGLIMLNEPKPGDFKQSPQLAESWEQPDDQTIVLHIRKGVKYANVAPANGREMTAADVVFSLKRMATNDPKYPRRTWFTQVESIEASDPNTVRITTKRPYAALMHLLGSPWVVVISPEEVSQDGAVLKNLVGTGPYIAKKIDIGTEFLFERNPDYWDTGKPYIDTVHFLNIQTVASQLAAFRSGQTQYADPGSDLLAKFRSDNPTAREWIGPRVGIGVVAMNDAKAPFKDIRVRQAIANAVDLPGWMDVLVKGDGIQTGPMYAGYAAWALPQEKLLYSKPDIKKAKDLMHAAGLDSGFKTTVITLAAATYQGQAVQMKADLAQLNIDIDIQVISPADLTTRAFVQKDFEMYAGQDFSADDPDQLGDRFISTSAQNYNGYANTQVDQWFDEESQIMDQTQQQLMQDVPTLFTFISNGHYFYAGNLRGYRRSPLNANAERMEARGMYSVSQ